MSETTPVENVKNKQKSAEPDSQVPPSSTTESCKSTRIEPGYGSNFPKELLQKREFEYECEAKRIPTIKLTRSLLVVSVKGIALEKFDLGDWVFALNDVALKSKRQYFSALKGFVMSKQPYKLKFTIYRTIKTMKITNVHSSPFIPQATETQNGYEYLIGYITMYPGSSLGINIKSYNYKVYVTSTDNGFQSLGMRTLLVGDAILAVDGQPQTTVAGTSTLMIQALTKNRYVSIVIERAESEAAIQQVKLALLAEKTYDIDPRLPDDVIDICKSELTRMVKQQNEDHLMPIYKHPNLLEGCFPSLNKPGKGAVTVSEGSLETAIGMDPINPVLLQHVPPLPGPRPNIPILVPGMRPNNLQARRQSASAKKRRISFTRKPQLHLNRPFHP